MKPQFHEDYQNEHTDPLTSTEQSDFDWEALYQKLDGAENQSGETPEQIVLNAFRRIFDWVLNNNYNITANQLTPDTIIGRRFIALAWVTNPDFFPGSPSLNQLARQLGLTVPALATLTGEVCREFGIQNRAQAHAWNRGQKNSSEQPV
jgi:hypothetical protein